MRYAMTILAAAFLAAGAGPVAGQAWDAPSFLSPRPGDDLGVYFFDPAGGDWGLMGIWRQTGAINLGVRGGIADTPGDARILLGSEVFGSLVEEGYRSPLDLTWTAGIGATFGDGTAFRIPVGMSIGREFRGAGFGLQPYVHPRVAFDHYSSGDASDSEFNVLADLGVDMHVGSSLKLRVGASLGDAGDAFGFGVAWRAERGVAVR